MPTPGFDIYYHLDLQVEVEAHILQEHELRVVGEFFKIDYFKAGDFLIQWPDGKGHSVIPPEIFTVRYRKKEPEVAQEESSPDVEPDLVEVLEPMMQVYWNSPDEARDFAADMQHALDHPEEQDEGRQFTPEEAKWAKLYIRKAEAYLESVDETM